MRKIILDLAVSLDGMIEGPNGEVDWCIMDDDMDFPGFLSGIDTILYGRASYEAWGNFQPPPDASDTEKSLWREVHSKKKYVFSRKLGQDDRAVFISSDIAEKMKRLKQEEGRDIWLYGGASLIASFVDLGLIDVYRISIHPTVLGSGKPLFQNLKQTISFRLSKVNRFRSGVVQVIYEPGKKG
ncbi:MAG TPA: dihydrofolate reductase family protein [Flavisolibacter sp.]|nr:dihydrofolate reductase family protein [Flavisolibacter sp.]